MVLIRHFEEAVRGMYAAGLVPGLVHLCSGQEGTNVGVMTYAVLCGWRLTITAVTAIASPRARRCHS